MIFSPLPGSPIITQGFGQNPQIYSQFGLLGHNGLDFGVPVGTVIYAPHDGIAELRDDQDKNYGVHIILKDTSRMSVLAHLQTATITHGQKIYQGDPIALSGNSGFSSNPHLHWTFKLLVNGRVQNANNGYEGAVDVSQFTRLWQDKDLYTHAVYTDFSKEYLALEFPSNVFLKNTNRIA